MKCYCQYKSSFFHAFFLVLKCQSSASPYPGNRKTNRKALCKWSFLLFSLPASSSHWCLCFVFTFKLITLISSWLPLKLEKAAVIKRYDPWREQAIRTYKPSWWVCLPLYFLSFTLPVRMKWDTLNY